MSFKLIVRVFCDSCGKKIIEAGRSLQGRATKKEAWKIAKSFVWIKIGGRRLCRECKIKLTQRK